MKKENLFPSINSPYYKVSGNSGIILDNPISSMKGMSYLIVIILMTFFVGCNPSKKSDQNEADSTVYNDVTMSENIQSEQSISDLLWEQVEDCDNNIEDVDGDGKKDYTELIDDSNNGYLKISGQWPTCGCDCSKTVGAYQSSDGSYTFLSQAYWGCSWISEIKANKDLKEILPAALSIYSFIPNATQTDMDTMARFFITVEIPRIGTDTKININIVPFGMYSDNSWELLSMHLSYGTSQNESTSRSLRHISQIANNIKNDETLDLILNDQFEKVTKEDQEIVTNAYQSAAELKEDLLQLKRTYDLYLSIEHEWVTLGWNKEQSKFDIISRGSRPEPKTFRQFLKTSPFWEPLC